MQMDKAFPWFTPFIRSRPSGVMSADQRLVLADPVDRLVSVHSLPLLATYIQVSVAALDDEVGERVENHMHGEEADVPAGRRRLVGLQEVVRPHRAVLVCDPLGRYVQRWIW